MIETIRSQPRMRTIKKAIAELRTADPETDFSESRLRKMIASGEVPAMKQGKRYLVDLNVLYAVLGAMTFPAIFTSTGSIISGTAGTIVALVLSYRRKWLLQVAVGACAAAFLMQLVQMLF